MSVVNATAYKAHLKPPSPFCSNTTEDEWIKKSSNKKQSCTSLAGLFLTNSTQTTLLHPSKKTTTTTTTEFQNISELWFPLFFFRNTSRYLRRLFRLFCKKLIRRFQRYNSQIHTISQLTMMVMAYCFKQSHSCLRETNLFIKMEPYHSGVLRQNLHTVNHFMPLASFYTPWKHQKISGFLMVSGGIERDQWHEIVNLVVLLAHWYRKLVVFFLMAHVTFTCSK